MWGAPHCSVLPGVRILNFFLQNQAPNPLSSSCSFVFPPHSQLHRHPSTAGAHLEVQTIWVSLPCFPACAFESTWWPSFWHHGGVTAIPSELCVPPWCCSTAPPWQSGACRSQLCPRGGYFSLAPLAWWNPPGSGFCSAQQKQRHQQKQSQAFFIPMQLLDGVTWSLWSLHLPY